MTGHELKNLIGSSPDEWQVTLYDEYKNYVYTIVYNRLRNIASAEDIEECVSDAFADIFLDTDRFLAMDDLRGIVGLIAKRKAIDCYRKLSERHGERGALEGLTDGSDMEKASEKRELAGKVMQCITSLGRPDSSIIIMKYYYGMRSSLIGEKLGMKPAAVRKRSERALARLRELLAAEGIDGKDW